jgi:hypothetical protein
VTEEKKPTEKTLEMRVAAIEDFLAKRQVTEEEMRTFEKVANLLYGPTHLCHQPQPQPQPPQPQPDHPPRSVCYPSPNPPDYGGRTLCGPAYSGPCYFCRPVCYECFCAPCSYYGGGGFGGRFGGFGF